MSVAGDIVFHFYIYFVEEAWMDWQNAHDVNSLFGSLVWTGLSLHLGQCLWERSEAESDYVTMENFHLLRITLSSIIHMQVSLTTNNLLQVELSPARTLHNGDAGFSIPTNGHHRQSRTPTWIKGWIQRSLLSCLLCGDWKSQTESLKR